MWVVLTVVMWFAAGVVRGEDIGSAVSDVGCTEAKLRCAYRAGCGRALTNYVLWCSDLVRGVSKCPEACQHALIALTSTEEGKLLMNVSMAYFKFNSDAWITSSILRIPSVSSRGVLPSTINILFVFCLVRMRRRLLPRDETTRRNMSSTGLEGIPERNRLLQSIPADMRGRCSVFDGPALLSPPVRVHVQGEEVLAEVPQLHQHPQEAGEGRQAEHVQVRRLRGLRLSQGAEQHGAPVLPEAQIATRRGRRQDDHGTRGLED